MIKQSIKMSLSAITSNKMRSFLTMLGIIIGVLTVCLVSTTITGVSNIIIDEFGTLASNYCQVNFLERTDFSQNDTVQMKKDLLAIEKACSFGVTKATSSTDQISNYTTLGFVSDSDFQSIVDLRLECGRFFIPEEIEFGAPVCVLSYQTAVDYFHSANNAIGKQIFIEGIDTKVIGVMKKPSVSVIDYGSVLIPYLCYSDIYRDLASYIQVVLIKTNAAMDLDDCVLQIENYLKDRFNETEDILTVDTLSGFLALYNMIATALKLLFIATSLLTMVISGTGIMNVMIVSVTSRTREIGIRKSIGATGTQIKVQFLLESIMISVIGAAIGVVLYYILTPVLQLAISYVFVPVNLLISSQSIVLATGFAVLVGILFGYQPANKASNMNPVDALRYDG